MSSSRLEYDISKTIYITSIPVLINHINYGNHLGYDAALSIAQDARIRWLKENDMTELSISGSVGYIIAGAEQVYKSEAFHGDTLGVELYISDITKKTFQLMCRLVNESTRTIVAIIKTDHVFYDYALKKIGTVPELFSSQFASTE